MIKRKRRDREGERKTEEELSYILRGIRIVSMNVKRHRRVCY